MANMMGKLLKKRVTGENQISAKADSYSEALAEEIFGCIQQLKVHSRDNKELLDRIRKLERNSAELLQAADASVDHKKEDYNRENEFIRRIYKTLKELDDKMNEFISEQEEFKMTEKQRADLLRREQELKYHTEFRKQEELKRQLELERKESKKQEELKSQEELRRQEVLKKQEETRRLEELKRQEDNERLSELKELLEYFKENELKREEMKEAEVVIDWQEKIKILQEELEETIHKENVKCYRNLKCVLEEQEQGYQRDLVIQKRYFRVMLWFLLLVSTLIILKFLGII